MEGRLRKFEEVVQGVKDATEITNMRNLYPRIRRFISQCQEDIGWSNALTLKRYTYSKEKGTLLNKRIKLPADFVYIDKFGTCCMGGLCPGQYQRQGNYIHFCVDRDKITLYYFAFTCDGNGNPVVSQNHFEAIVAGIVYKLYLPKRFNDKGSRATYLDFKNEYFDRIGEARGDDAWPSTREEWNSLGQITRMSTLEAMALLPEYYGCCELYQETSENCAEVSPLGVYHWQYNDLSINNANKPPVTQDWLNANATRREFSAFQNGLTISYTEIGRIGFAVLPIESNKLVITDILGNDITSTVFEKSYDSNLQMEIFVSKEHMTHSNIYFKFNQV